MSRPKAVITIHDSVEDPELLDISIKFFNEDGTEGVDNDSAQTCHLYAMQLLTNARDAE